MTLLAVSIPSSSDRGSSLPPFASSPMVNADPFRRSAEIVRSARLNLAEARDVLRCHARAVIEGAFPEPSRHQTCLTAAQACGTSPDTILRLIEGSTASPDALVLGYCARVYHDRTGRISPIHLALAQIIAAEVVR